MKNKIKIIIFGLSVIWTTMSCDNYIDVVPDNVATIDNAFTDRNQAEKFLYTLYSYLPKIGHPQCAGRFDDLTWGSRGSDFLNMYPLFSLRNGNNASKPYCNYWEGGYGATLSLFQGIRDCNTFMDKIDEVRDLDPMDKVRWVAEAKFLKAYYHFYLLQLYGPVPVIERNLPVSANEDEVMMARQPVDKVFSYIYQLIDEAVPNLPSKIEDVAIEMGRLTQPAALAMKAKIAVTAASPLFNGNTTYAGFVDKQNRHFFNQQEDPEKWSFAAACCKAAIDTCLRDGHDLYVYNGVSLSTETQKIVQTGRIITDRWNKEHIWSLTTMPGNGIIDEYTGAALTSDHNNYFRGIINPTIKAMELFYSKNGVPIDEDRFYDYDNCYNIITTTVADSKYVQTGVKTVGLHLNREYRFYGSMAVDGGWWYGLGRYTETGQWPVNIKSGGASGQRGGERYPCTGMYIKKLISMESSFNSTNYMYVRYDYPIIRLADLYLLYAEALNETLGAPSDEVYEYVNRIRNRAGLENIQDAYRHYAKNPDKYQSKTGMREIIRRERSIELAFEGHRLFDIRRWNTATTELNGPIKGWNYLGDNPDDFYQVVTVDNVTYTDRDVLWPIRTVELAKNHNLVQNPGWQ